MTRCTAPYKNVIYIVKISFLLCKLISILILRGILSKWTNIYTYKKTPISSHTNLNEISIPASTRMQFVRNTIVFILCIASLLDGEVKAEEQVRVRQLSKCVVTSMWHRSEMNYYFQWKWLYFEICLILVVTSLHQCCVCQYDIHEKYHSSNI